MIRWSRNRQYYFQLHDTGYNIGLETSIRIKPLSSANLEIGYQNQRFLDNDMDLMPVNRVGQSDVKIWTFRGRYLITKDIFTRVFYQITNNAENFVQNNSFFEYEVRDRMSANFLLGWRYSPGSTLYLAYTEEWNERKSQSYISSNRILYIKISYLWSI
ncbi:MAG: hypothetical protein EH225_01025 [Calditrichaeota bacterium]|nr:MAG: hypothetical protein EH225_01025 [Calditrichota bacterium]